MATKSNGIKKKVFLAKMEATMGNVTTSCKAAEISRVTYYKWYKEDACFAAAVDQLAEQSIDFAESSLMQQIKDGNTTATIFYLKTKGKKRGYVETQEINATGLTFVIDQKGLDAAKELEGE